MTDKFNGLIIRVFDTEIEIWKSEYPALYANFGFTDQEIAQMVAADRMKKTFASRAYKWVVQKRETCDDAVLGWRLGILAEDQLPLGSK